MASGKDGTAFFGGKELAAEVTGWTFDETVDIEKYGSNLSGDGKTKNVGRKDHVGTVTFKGNPGLNAGDEVTVHLWNGEESFAGTAIVASIPTTCDINTGNANEYTANLEFDGAVTKGTSSAPAA